LGYFSILVVLEPFWARFFQSSLQCHVSSKHLLDRRLSII